MDLRFASCDLQLLHQCDAAVGRHGASVTVRSQIPNRKLQIATAFTLTEVMFAVMILGIGFIMLAAMFPVAIQQAKQTAQETTGAALAKNASESLRQIFVSCNQYLSVTGPGGVTPQVWSPRDLRNTDAIARDRLWLALRGNLISSQDPRYAFVPLYLRGQNVAGRPNPFVQVFLFAVASNASEGYVAETGLFRYNASGTGLPNDTTTNNYRATLEPKPVRVDLLHALVSPNGVDQITISDSAVPQVMMLGAYLAAGEGAYVVISNSVPLGANIGNGRIYKLGSALPTALANTLVFQLAPGYELDTTGAEDWANATAFLIGRPYADPRYPTQNPPFTGPVQDIGVYTTIINVN